MSQPGDYEDSGDKARLESLFKFIVRSITQGHQLSERKIGERLTGDRTQGRQLYLALKEKRNRTTADVVEILAAIKKQVEKSSGIEPSRWLSFEQIYVALQKLVILTPEEKRKLGFSNDGRFLLMQQAIINTHLYQGPSSHKELLDFYRQSIKLPSLDAPKVGQMAAQPNLIESNDANQQAGLIKQWITSSIDDYMRAQFGDTALKKKDFLEQKTKIIGKIDREISRILLKAGATQLRQPTTISDKDETRSLLSSYDSQYMQRNISYDFVRRLTQSVVENVILNEELPIFVDHIEIQNCGPFPLTVAPSFQERGALSQTLLNLDEKSPEIADLTSHDACRVTLRFNIRLPDSFTDSVPNSTIYFVDKGRMERHISFAVSSTGIGNTLSNIIKILNYVLLYDVETLENEFFHIAQDIVLEQDNTQINVSAPVVTHNLTKLCKVDVLHKAMKHSRREKSYSRYEDFAFDDPVGRGDYAAFDTLIGVARAALQARLKAIKLAGIDPKEYISDLLASIKEHSSLRQANSYVENYPFSSAVKDAAIRQSKKYEKFQNNPRGKINAKCTVISACLSLAETFLKEGFHEKAKFHLDEIYTVMEAASDGGRYWYDEIHSNSNSLTEEENDNANFVKFSSTLIVRYELCQATYSYLVADVDAAWKRLVRAEQHLTIRHVKYAVIGEVPQTIFHPYFTLKSWIFFLKTRLVLFFPCNLTEADAEPCLPPTLYNALKGNRRDVGIQILRQYCVEKARLYAAADGDCELYAVLTAYQSVLYLTATFLKRHSIEMKSDSIDFKLKPSEAREWARRLRNNALLAYREAGSKYYLQLKGKSGIPDKPEDRQRYPFKIDPIPSIQENYYDQEFIENSDILNLNMSLLTVEAHSLNDLSTVDDIIYLFGPNACYLFFARGFYHLVSNFKYEFGENTIVSDDDWEDKFNLAYNLFGYAWSIADGGCNLEIGKDSDTVTRLSREFSGPSGSQQESLKTAPFSAVANLYPYRISDISPLARTFCATCKVLNIYTQAKDYKQKICSDITPILEDLYSVDVCKQKGMNKFLHGQPSLNTHLKSFLEHSKNRLELEMKRACQDHEKFDTKSIIKRRDALLRDLLSSLGEENGQESP